MTPVAYRQALTAISVDATGGLFEPLCKVCMQRGTNRTKDDNAVDFSTIQHGLVWDGEKMAECFVGEAGK